MGNGWPQMSSYVTETPHYIGQFPALAFAVHNRHFDEGQIVSARRFSESAIFGGTDVLDQTFGLVGFDENEPLGAVGNVLSLIIFPPESHNPGCLHWENPWKF